MPKKVGSRLRSVTQKRYAARFPVTYDYVARLPVTYGDISRLRSPVTGYKWLRKLAKKDA